MWPENWPAFELFSRVSTQWRVAMGGPIGLDYGPLLALMARTKMTDDDHDALFDDVQTLERAALAAMSEKT